MIRKMEPNDIDAIMRIWKKETIRAHHFIPETYWERHYEAVKAMIPHADVYVSILNGSIVGFLGLDHNHIEGLFVDEENQRKGVGRALLHQAKEERDHLSLYVYI